MAMIRQDSYQQQQGHHRASETKQHLLYELAHKKTAKQSQISWRGRNRSVKITYVEQREIKMTARSGSENVLIALSVVCSKHTKEWVQGKCHHQSN